MCFYCASHQELRELAVRGVDGPGLHIQDVLSSSFPPEADQAAAARAELVNYMLSHPPELFKSRVPKDQKRFHRPKSAVLRTFGIAPREREKLEGGESTELSHESQSEMMGAAFGWARFQESTPLIEMAPETQLMRRTQSENNPLNLKSEIIQADDDSEEYTSGHRRPVRKSWSIAY